MWLLRGRGRSLLVHKTRVWVGRKDGQRPVCLLVVASHIEGLGLIRRLASH